MVLGDTSRVPNQGATIASETIQITAVPLRQAAAHARHLLLAKAAEKVGLPIERAAAGGRHHPRRRELQLSFGDVVVGTIRLSIDSDAALKPVGL